MKKFILQTALFLLPFLLLFSLIESLYTRVPNIYSKKSEVVAHRFDSIEVTIMGPSVTLRGVNPDYIEQPTYNLSLNGLDWEMGLAVTRYMLNFPNDIRHIILSSNINNLYQGPREIKGSDRVYFAKYFDLPEFRTYLAQEKGLLMIQRILKYHLRGIEPNLKIDSSGFSTQRKKKDVDLAKEGNRLEALLQWNNTRFIPSKQENLDSIISICERNNIHLTLLSPPVHSSFRPKDIEEKSKRVDGILESYDQQFDHVHFLNWMEHPEFKAEYFNDPIHLNEQGARKLSIMLDAHIQNLESIEN